MGGAGRVAEIDMGRWDSAEPFVQETSLGGRWRENVRTVLLCGGSINTNNGHKLLYVALFSRKAELTVL